MRERKFTTWEGSRPEVGSSRIRSGGLPSRACANPTRWRLPFESLRMCRLAFSPSQADSIASTTSRRRSARGTPLSRATWSR